MLESLIYHVTELCFLIPYIHASFHHPTYLPRDATREVLVSSPRSNLAPSCDSWRGVSLLVQLNFSIIQGLSYIVLWVEERRLKILYSIPHSRQEYQWLQIRLHMKEIAPASLALYNHVRNWIETHRRTMMHRDLKDFRVPTRYYMIRVVDLEVAYKGFDFHKPISASSHITRKHLNYSFC